jgi:hypothetical protein
MHDDVAKQFTHDVVNHTMFVRKDDGLYRHLEFRRPTNEIAYFNITTWPGFLAISGDGGNYTFSCMEDMFQMFRAGSRINPSYWGEKLRAVDEQGGYERYLPEEVFAFIERAFDEWNFESEYDKKQSYGRIVMHLSDLGETCENSHDAAQEINGYTCAVTGQEFDVDDGEFYGFTYRYLWACHAIKWAIEQYDDLKLKVAA